MLFKRRLWTPLFDNISWNAIYSSLKLKMIDKCSFHQKQIKIQDSKSGNWPDFCFFDGMKNHLKLFCENGKYGFSNYFYHFLWKLFRWYVIPWNIIPWYIIPVSYHRWQTVPSKKIVIKHGNNDQKTYISHFHTKKFWWYIIPSKNENLVNFSFLNPESLRNITKILWPLSLAQCSSCTLYVEGRYERYESYFSTIPPPRSATYRTSHWKAWSVNLPRCRNNIRYISRKFLKNKNLRIYFL